MKQDSKLRTIATTVTLMALVLVAAVVWRRSLSTVSAAKAAIAVPSRKPGKEIRNYPEPPPRFTMSFKSFYVNTQVVTATLSGVGDEKMGLIVLPEGTVLNRTGAVWRILPTNLVIDLGPTDGRKEVWLGRRDLAGGEGWDATLIALDRVGPKLVITEPKTLVVSGPTLQIKGYSQEELASIRYDLVNSAVTNLDVQSFGVDSFDQRTFSPTTNWFQLFDVELAPGTNTITLRATDLAGNSATNSLVYVLDFASDHAAPVLELAFPKSGSEISGDKFTVRGMVSEPDAVITLKGLTIESMQGQVERNGRFWVEEVPLSPGTNRFTLTATDPAGNGSSTNFSVVRGVSNLIIDPMGEIDAGRSTIKRITGSFDLPNHTIWINGVKATSTLKSPNLWTWVATNVPIKPGGVAIVEAAAIANSDNGGYGSFTNPAAKMLKSKP